MKTSQFEKLNQLLIDVIYETVRPYETFIHVRSVFTDEWYNFIVPQVSPNDLDWGEVEEVISTENDRGYQLSYYVPEKLYEEYKKYFKTKPSVHESESDCYIYSKTNEINDPIGELVEVTDQTLVNYIQMAETCFPEWDGSAEYAKYLYAQGLLDQKNIVKLYFYKANGKIVGISGLLASKDLKLGYIHNTGVLPEYRRQGHFTNMIKLLKNTSFEADIPKLFALVDEKGISHKTLKKLGFEVKQKYILFSM